MSTTDTETNEGRESGLFRREFQADLVAGDGRTLDVRIVPYGETALVDDGHGPYKEEFVRGAFDDQLVAGHRLKVWLNFQHERGLQAIVGKGVHLREEVDGLHGTFRVLEHPDGDKALALLDELDSVSLEFLAKKTVRAASGVVRRVKAHLDAVALCRRGAYPSAKVLAVREDVVAPYDPILDEELLPLDLDSELVERLRANGVALPDRYTRHPAPESDTPVEVTDTSEDDGTPLIDFTRP